MRPYMPRVSQLVPMKAVPRSSGPGGPDGAGTAGGQVTPPGPPPIDPAGPYANLAEGNGSLPFVIPSRCYQCEQWLVGQRGKTGCSLHKPVLSAHSTTRSMGAQSSMYYVWGVGEGMNRMPQKTMWCTV